MVILSIMYKSSRMVLQRSTVHANIMLLKRDCPAAWTTPYMRCHSADNVGSLHAFAMFTECEDVEKYRETLRVPQMRGYHPFSG